MDPEGLTNIIKEQLQNSTNIQKRLAILATLFLSSQNRKLISGSDSVK